MNSINASTPARNINIIGEISTPQQVAEKAQAVANSRANKRNGGMVTNYGARYSKRADQITFTPIGVNPVLMDRAENLRLALPLEGRTEAQRAVAALVDTPRNKWVGCPSNALIQEVLDICEAQLDAGEIEAVDSILDATLLTCTP